MSQRLLVCCLNVQEARNSQVIDKLKKVCSGQLVQSFIDPLFNRSNLTICGESDDIYKVVEKLSDVALEHINMNNPARLADKTMHHHIGVLDLIPVHPLANTTLEDAGELAVRISESLNSKEVPTLLYGSADLPRSRSLVQVRKQTSFFQRGQNSCGDAVSGHPTMGTSVVGATPYVLSFNMVINTTNIADVAEAVLGLRSKEHGVQVMPYTNLFEKREVVEIACNLLKPGSPEGCQECILNNTRVLMETCGLEVIHSYSTNPPFESILEMYHNLVK